MKKYVFALIIFVVLAWSFINFILYSDDKKFASFEDACLGSSEKIFTHVSSNTIALEYFPVSGVIEKDYYPIQLAKSLLNDSKGFKKVQLLFSSDNLSSTRPKNKDYCYGKFLINAAKPKDLKLGLCGMVNGKEYHWEPQDIDNVASYIIKYRYGKVNQYDIRQFDFSIEERVTGKVIAEQNSYQLLLGNMSKKENRSWVGWGAAQGARSCKLTDPSKFVLSAVAPNG